MIGTITAPAIKGCDATFEKLKTFLEASTAHLPGTLTGYIVQAEAPGVDDRRKLWLKLNACGATWHHWDVGCGRWCAVDGVPGEHITRNRVNATVKQDLQQYYCGYELADGSNILGVDLRGKLINNTSSFDLVLENSEVGAAEFEEEPILLMTSSPAYTLGGPVNQSGTIDLTEFGIDRREGLYICVHPVDAVGSVTLNGIVVWVETNTSNDQRCTELTLDGDTFPYQIELTSGQIDIFYHGVKTA